MSRRRPPASRTARNGGRDTGRPARSGPTGRAERAASAGPVVRAEPAVRAQRTARAQRIGPAGRAAGAGLAVVDRGRPRTPRAFLARVVRAALAHGGQPGLPVSLLLTGDAEIAALHERWFRDPTPTDVISFLVDGTAEIAVSVATARRVARARGHGSRAEIALYVVHGLLHVLGHDDTTSRARARMRAAERAVLQRLGLAVAPVDAR